MRRRTGRPEGFDYQVLHNNSHWAQHEARTNVTAGLIAWLRPRSVLDPACGDGSIVWAADQMCRIDRISLSDISQPNIQAQERQWSGRLLNKALRTLPKEMDMGLWCRDIVTALSEDTTFDVVVLTEILEHLKDPDAILAMAHERADYLVASSPEIRPEQRDTNPEHLWEFDGDGYAGMLMATGWWPIHKTHMGFPHSVYDFQVWVCAADGDKAKRVFTIGPGR